MIAFFGKLRKELVAVVSSCSQDFVEVHDAELREPCARFEEVLQLIGSVHMTAFDENLAAALKIVVASSESDAGFIDDGMLTKVLHELDECFVKLPSAEDAGVRVVGSDTDHCSTKMGLA